MAYMAQQAVRTAIRDAFADRSDAGTQAEEAGRFRHWLESLPLDRGLIAAIAEPIEALEEGLRDADRSRRRSTEG